MVVTGPHTQIILPVPSILSVQVAPASVYESQISRVSEEHGIIDEPADEFAIGDKLLIIPNHGCAVVNLYDYYLLLEDEEVREVKIDARGMSK